MMKSYKDDIEYMRRTGTPRCPTCKKDMIQEKEYTWKPDCKCISPNLRLSVG